ncbi:DUF4124 domain-containing protein [Rhodoferax saidenbachensis]|uniref:DUF4124 domain-containing protein n=1 Tax=Rhodoferax saidenbachensis TaxID=1484693 RepID=A0A1P8KF00_9BURK|nr:DUF4124 domain-containing protein [Rhodoferax saidenbachensis]APW44541.1 DUF4124 domain-containing protein [Rhodoferax saidenbachensis]
MPLRIFKRHAATLRRGRQTFPLVGLTLMLLTSALGATSICRWVDANGRTQMSDVVPDGYQNSASCTNSQKYELSPEQQRDAEKRAADERSLLRSHEQGMPPKTPSSPAAPAGAETPVRTKRPAQLVTDSTDCQTWWRIYDESSECFGPFKTTQGGIKPEAFDQCNEVKSPELQCGPRRN